MAAKGEVSQVLDIMEGDPVLVVEQKLMDEKDHPIGWGLMYFTVRIPGWRQLLPSISYE